MLWSIVDVARLSGVTARTLRHYDAIGLLRPAATGAGGLRRYDARGLLRLQRVLLLRALGMPLGEIGAVLDQQRDELAALRLHHRRLLAERDRFAGLAATVARTIEELARQEGAIMTIERPENLFEGFQPEDHAAEARRRWPAEAASSEAYASSLTPADVERLQRETTAQIVRMADLRAAGRAVDDPAVQSEIHALHTAITRMWVPNAGAFAALGRMYVDDPRFRETYDRVSPGIATYFRDAMAVYASQRLG